MLLSSVSAATDTSGPSAIVVERASSVSTRYPAYLLQQLAQQAAAFAVSSANAIQCALLSLLQARIAFRRSSLNTGESAAQALQHSLISFTDKVQGNSRHPVFIV